MLSTAQSLDEARRRYPHLGMALYAYEPGGLVTLECHTPSGEVFTFIAETEALAIAKAFPPDVDDEPAPEPEASKPTTTTSVFD